ncbi:unnamed protein product [Didymodactylos carnosus]|uniref:Uncharacterized protein n=1 Tax=Didymodactylos carnosus TaxID=1234261 RepID=A0A814Y8C9_9BILA|nr:unnamed protein product [Didymodactylos carnosus]CAF1504181.1 unnamed protein product [Didymodactylos carnosus]CAF3988613.1 unnamed protein product [Didymodactylos carnosus]CAF4292491.1 unnamed protein product [Didymodactylos carnosus]
MNECKESTYLSYMPVWNDCKPVELFWGSPVNNLTIIFQTNLTTAHQFCLSGGACIDDGIMLITDKAEEKVSLGWSPESRCFKRNAGENMIKFKFMAGEKWHCYGTTINYSYEQ